MPKGLGMFYFMHMTFQYEQDPKLAIYQGMPQIVP
jgi:hypothetical protein